MDIIPDKDSQFVGFSVLPRTRSAVEFSMMTPRCQPTVFEEVAQEHSCRRGLLTINGVSRLAELN